MDTPHSDDQESIDIEALRDSEAPVKTSEESQSDVSTILLHMSEMKLSLLCFFLSVGVFLSMTYTLPNKFKDYPEETIAAAIFKCLPIASLAFLVYSTQVSCGGQGHLRKNMLPGLLFSMAGDFCLIWRHTLFFPGATFFAAAHMFYMRGFKTSPVGIVPGFICVTNAVVMFIFFLPDLHTPELLVVTGVYGLLVSCMWWRAIVHWMEMKTTASILGMLGAGCFNISDFILMLDHAKYIAQVPYASVLIMVTYYAAQLGIAMSVTLYAPHKAKKER